MELFFQFYFLGQCIAMIFLSGYKIIVFSILENLEKLEIYIKQYYQFE